MISQQLQIPLGLDLTAIAVGGLGGGTGAAQLGRESRIDVIGVAAIGIATGFGGSIVRDLLLNQLPAALHNDAYLLTALLAAFAGMAFAPLIERAATVLAVLDALTIGMYLSAGILKAERAGLPVGASVLVGVVACTGGGVIRDLLLGTEVTMVRVGSYYITAALAGAAVFIPLHHVCPVVYATTATVAIAFTLRAVALHRGWTRPSARPLPLPRKPVGEYRDVVTEQADPGVDTV
ncbi:trimeric intracellular cation channel family protein [Nocardia sp. NPDC059240]|uniref:trimeric intracellular cation channel family protein n=1 Tax=Nocardia sp. NPDC059240 TaxID=3346786 RepID=UPI003692FC73